MSPKKSSGGGIEVSLLGFTNIKPDDSASHAAFTCYQDKMPDLGKKIDVENRLFKVGHQTTLQHWHATFSIEGVSVGDVTFGLHLASPFYNSDQRSGRFCSAMFSNPDYKAFERYIRGYWHEVTDSKLGEIMEYIKFAIGHYQTNLDKATSLSRSYLSEERPNLPAKTLDANCGKIAQEQMRMFIPIIFPTALDYTINISSLVALWTCAWNSPMRTMTDMMRDLVLEANPEISFMFNAETRRRDDWHPKLKKAPFIVNVFCKPEHYLEECIVKEFVRPTAGEMHPVDLLHFKPEMMDNSDSFINAGIHISCATMGQDQRHRTIKRTAPFFTGHVYMPPLLEGLELGNELARVMERWHSVSSDLPGPLSSILAPYGAMVSYNKSGNLNAIAHEMAKRLCWCTQEEIYHLSLSMREQILEKHKELESIFSPPCVKNGKCGEGARYCGRDMKKLGFTYRKV